MVGGDEELLYSRPEGVESLEQKGLVAAVDK